MPSGKFKVHHLADIQHHGDPAVGEYRGAHEALNGAQVGSKRLDDEIFLAAKPVDHEAVGLTVPPDHHSIAVSPQRVDEAECVSDVDQRHNFVP